MNQSLWIAKTGLEAQQTKMSNIANNLANAGTTGFKRGRALFEDLLYQNVRQAGGQTSADTRLPSGLAIGTGVRVAATQKLFSQGNMAQTDNPLDMGIQGRGFFAVQLPDGNLGYTRDGSFMMNDQGQLSTSSGYVLQPVINIPEDTQSITIGADGTVTVQLASATEVSQVGNVQLTAFANPAGLQAIGQNMFLETSSSGAPQTGTPTLNGLGSLTQGYVETSNVNVVEELVGMIETQRAYEMNSKAISTTDQMLQYLNNNL